MRVIGKEFEKEYMYIILHIYISFIYKTEPICYTAEINTIL